MWTLIREKEYTKEYNRLAPNIQSLVREAENILKDSEDPIKLGERKVNMPDSRGNPTWTYEIGNQWRILYNIGDDRSLHIVYLIDLGDHKMYKKRNR